MMPGSTAATRGRGRGSSRRTAQGSPRRSSPKNALRCRLVGTCRNTSALSRTGRILFLTMRISRRPGRRGAPGGRRGGGMSERPLYMVGVDLGQASGPTAVVVVEAEGKGLGSSYGVRHLERHLGKSYVYVVEKLGDLCGKLARRG